MDIFIPKFGPERYIKDGHIKNCFKVKAEYRAVLRGPDGRVKHDTGWKPNDILHSGLEVLCERPDGFGWIALGTDGTAVNQATQTGILGTFLASASAPAGATNANSGSPNYVQSAVSEHTFPPGTGTGTIAEMSVGWYYTEDVLRNSASSRFVISPAIVKGVYDELTVSHKIYLYPDLTDTSGTITISGVGDYNYTLRRMGVHYVGGIYKDTHFRWTMGDLASFVGGQLTETHGDVSALEAYDTSMTLTDDKGGFTAANYTFSKTGLTSYKNTELIADIDSQLNGTFTRITARRERGTWVGLQMHFDKVAGGGGILKENTHELILNYRDYPGLYP